MWTQPLGTESDFLVAPLQRGLSEVTIPAPAFCADAPCALEAAVTWPRLGPLSERPEVGGAWPPPPPGAHVADSGAPPRGPLSVRFDRRIKFQVAGGVGSLRAFVTAPGPVAAGQDFEVAASVQTCRAGTDDCENSAGDVLVYVFAVDAAWASAEMQSPIAPEVPRDLTPGTIRDVGRNLVAFSGNPPAPDADFVRRVEFELPLATLLSPETERDIAQVRRAAVLCGHLSAR